MHFQFKPPSISKIRAKFIIEKLQNYPQNISSINIFATGRTHSGKTTLGNRLLGIDYFLSTGRQDCTKEINLIEFPIGLRYFDLPGVCSDDRLENYNRVALNLSQFEEFPFVDEVTLAKFKEKVPPSEQNLSINQYDNLNFKPDLIYYLIAPDKQFARGDRKYLADLLKRHQNVIYVFNMFVSKQTVVSYTATEANIQDVATQIIKVHRSILGADSPPKIVGVNCWTGEGIAELLHQSQEILPKEKGKVFQKLIEYQQQKTPDEYVNQVKTELVKLYAHLACQKSTGAYTCEQPLHKLCYSLLECLMSLSVQSKKIDRSITQQVNTVTNQIFSQTTIVNQPESLENKLNYIIRASDDILSRNIDLLNKLIEAQIRGTQRQGYELRNQKVDEFRQKNKSYEEQISQSWNVLVSENAEIDSLTQQIEDKEEGLDDVINTYNLSLKQYQYRCHEFNARIERWNQRRERYNANIDRINNSSARLTDEARQSIQQESNYLDEEINDIEVESSYIDDIKIDLDQEEQSIDSKIAKLNRKRSRRSNRVESLNEQFKEHLCLKKKAEDDINFCVEFIKAFDEEFNAYAQSIDARIDEINLRLEEIRNRYSDFYAGQFLSLEDAIDELQGMINHCLDEFSTFENQVFIFTQELKKCILKLNINQLASRVLQETTENYFDETGEFEYRGSNYNYFCSYGIAIGLAVTSISLRVTEKDVDTLYDECLAKVNQLELFLNPVEENQILLQLNSKIDLLFENEFDIREEEVKLITDQADFTQLDQFLSEGKWQEADEETARVMLTIMGRKEEGYLDEDDYRNFPSTELKIIDQLWLKCSNGKFGFSVQKQIWLDCGGTVGEYDSNIYRKFADKVGWRKGGSWLNYSQLNFTIDAPQAHIPSWGRVRLGVGYWAASFRKADLFSLL